MKVLVTGAAGFIGFHLSKRLLEEGCQVLGVDSLNDYYDVNLKKDRLGHLPQTSQFLFEHLDLADGDNLRSCVTSFNPEAVVNLAAQAGVRYSLENPLAYVNSNLVGFVNLMEACVRIAGLHHFVFGPSGLSVRGDQEIQRIDCSLLQPPLWHARHRSTVFHCIRALGPSRHGLLQIYRRDPSRSAH